MNARSTRRRWLGTTAALGAAVDKRVSEALVGKTSVDEARLALDEGWQQWRT
jgi:hypothetical protein